MWKYQTSSYLKNSISSSFLNSFFPFDNKLSKKFFQGKKRKGLLSLEVCQMLLYSFTLKCYLET